MIDDCYGYDGCDYCPNPCDDVLRQREEDD